MRIARALFDEMVSHARETGDEECCGLISTREDTAVQLYRTTNTRPTPKYGYEMDGMELFRIMEEIEDQGLELGAIYHSHPRSDPVPSQTDINLARYPDSVYIIVGNATTEPEVKGWTIRDGEIAETELAIV
jgi:[CysO sulfur-carrier protein]-S-L-cysteine hydrolase